MPSAMRPASAGTGQVTGFSGLASWGPPAPRGDPGGVALPAGREQDPAGDGQGRGGGDVDREIQAAARGLADELLPHEVEAELAGGELPDELLEKHRRRVAELGFEAINMPKELGGGGFTAFQQVLVQEQIGRVTNALGWVVHTPASWLPKVATSEQLDRWVVPTIRGERRECYAITEEGAGSDVDAIRATATRDGDGYR